MQHSAAKRAEFTTYRRIVALDVARGLAILGTLATNIWIFATWNLDSSVLEAALDPNYTVAGEIADVAAHGSGLELADALFSGLSYLITDGKFLGLLTIMFGIGLEIQRQSALKRGERWPGRYYWRAAILVGEGLLNYIFIFEFDVLMGYGLTALAVAPILARSEKVQKVWMWIGLSLHTIIMALISLSALWVANWAGEEWQEAQIAADDAAAADGGLALYTDTSNYFDMVRTRLADFVNGRFEIPIMVLMGLGVFILAARLYRAGLFQPAMAALRRKVMLVGLGVGLPLDWGLRLFASGAAAAFTRYVSSTVVAFGVLALIAAYYVKRDNRLGAVGSALAALGRMALTCYLLQNILASIVFYDFGLGAARVTAGEWQTLWVTLIYLALCGVLIGLSLLWLRFFPRGPVELAMHWAYEAPGRAGRRAGRGSR
ncbi:DUF418 domain-containing protein [Corynebacterium sp. TA-R-1]|uniref:DUF418 domain-containing protein n=1 Tax=Corynebacterium stercoris TaxID=2943490 RepID=A0ABT1G0T5_9CORY|nr:DUF418 domain-containing protein [Corynebacterium stercoris]MCP1387639.1 DUF418 domain-containing protein [Corynebacterium stercoris]